MPFSRRRCKTRVALAFAARVDDIFTSEATLQAAHEKYFQATPFDRTQHWDTILRKELAEDWKEFGPDVKSSMTEWDQRMILWHLSQVLDYNLFTQVMLNLQPGVLVPYSTTTQCADLEALKKKYEGKTPSIFDAKAKMVKSASTQGDMQFNMDLSTLKALKIASTITSFRSFRVSPKGSTPALADSENLSTMGIGGDKYLNVPPGYKAWYVVWDFAPNLLLDAGKGPNGFPQFHALGNIQYPFESKSGGEMLNGVLFSRFITARLFSELALDFTVTFIPRLTSVLMVTDAPVERVQVALCRRQSITFFIYLLIGTLVRPHWQLPNHTPLRTRPYRTLPTLIQPLGS